MSKMSKKRVSVLASRAVCELKGVRRSKLKVRGSIKMQFWQLFHRDMLLPGLRTGFPQNQSINFWRMCIHRGYRNPHTLPVNAGCSKAVCWASHCICFNKSELQHWSLVVGRFSCSVQGWCKPNTNNLGKLLESRRYAWFNSNFSNSWTLLGVTFSYWGTTPRNINSKFSSLNWSWGFGSTDGHKKGPYSLIMLSSGWHQWASHSGIGYCISNNCWYFNALQWKRYGQLLWPTVDIFSNLLGMLKTTVQGEKGCCIKALEKKKNRSNVTRNLG